MEESSRSQKGASQPFPPPPKRSAYMGTVQEENIWRCHEGMQMLKCGVFGQSAEHHHGNVCAMSAWGRRESIREDNIASLLHHGDRPLNVGQMSDVHQGLDLLMKNTGEFTKKYKCNISGTRPWFYIHNPSS